MSAVLANGFRIDQKHKDLDETKAKITDIRTTVNIDFQIPKLPVLAMKWVDFGWSSLSLGANPLDFNLKHPKMELKDPAKNGAVLLRGLKTTDDGNWNFTLEVNKHYQFSIKRALAWLDIMCLERKDSIVCRHAISCKEDQLGPDVFSNPRRLKNQPDGQSSRAKKTSAALTWIFFCEQLEGRPFHEIDQRLVPQWIREARERSLFHFHGLDQNGILKEKISDLTGDKFDEAEPPWSTESSRIHRNSTQDTAVNAAGIAHQILRLLQDDFESSFTPKNHTCSTSPCALLLNIGNQIQPRRCLADGMSPRHRNTAESRKLNTQRCYTNSPSRGRLLQNVIECPQFSELKRHFNPQENERVFGMKSFFHRKNGPWRCAVDSMKMRDGINVSLQRLERDEPGSPQMWKAYTIVQHLEKLGEDAKEGIFEFTPASDMVYDLFERKKPFELSPEVVYLV
ncbi:hypothetical protein IWX90DRAFT_496649 [Phyllosticta citrichinensis]|uniref:Uncharacterized protein n=1 Tax=Phyllosticta citrichinensis TaxID=1130410 RepID=A0ABR1Y1E1_9PEZI